MDKEQNVEHFLSLIRKAKRGHLKIYIGMIAGVGKTYRMLREAHDLLTAGVDVQVGYAETHGRVDTAAKLEGQGSRRDGFTGNFTNTPGSGDCR